MEGGSTVEEGGTFFLIIFGRLESPSPFPHNRVSSSSSSSSSIMFMGQSLFPLLL